ncbi:MAG: hypothetical protein ACKOE6_05875, partial [Flammeovirgaceae bacterium]
MRFLVLVGFVLGISFVSRSQTITTGTISGSPFCAGATVSVPYTITGSYGGGNVFTAQLSNAAGSFAAPTAIGTLTSTAAGTITATIPLTQGAGAAYRIRVMGSNPAVTGTQSATFTVTALGIAAPTVAGSPFCAGSTFNITNNLSNACAFGTGNTFTVQLSDSGGAFGSPTTIGSASSTTGGIISVTLPLTLTGSANYRMRVVGSNPAVTGTQSATFTVTA